MSQIDSITRLSSKRFCTVQLLIVQHGIVKVCSRFERTDIAELRDRRGEGSPSTQ